ncbi:MAG: adenylate/guanylate cyclase domain-containing protein [Candidatus Eiseniibacteriota bacterium]
MGAERGQSLGADDGARSKSRRTYSFALLTTLTTVLLVVVVAAGFGVVGYDASTAIEARALHDRFSLLYRGASNYLQQSVRSVSIAQRTLSAHFTRDRDGAASGLLTREPYKALVNFSREFPMVEATYVGYSDGSFEFFADLRRWTAGMRKALAAPETAVGAVRHIDPNGAQRWTFYDKAGAQLPGTQSNTTTELFDPRKRPWFRDAMAADTTILTEPYIFAITGQLGLTIATKLANGDGVFGADMTFDDIARFAREMHFSPSSVVVLFTRDGWVLGHGRARAGGGAQATAELALFRQPARVAELGDRVLEQLLRLGLNPKASAEALSDGGRQYLLEAAPISAVVGSELYLGVAAPIDELDTGLKRRIVLAALVALAALLLGAWMAVISARLLSKPIARLGGEARRLAALDFSEPSAVDSRVTEVHDLADALERARHALRTFATYVPRQLVHRLIRNPRQARLAGERRRLGLMFTDIVGYSTIAERLEPEDLMTRTSAYFERIGQIIAANNGIIDKFIGDAVMAMWNAPDLDPDYARDCCRAALAVAAAVRDFNDEAMKSQAPQFRTRIGIHAGDCVVGNVGSSDRVGYTAMGAEVNLASRVEGLNGHYGTTILATRTLVEETQAQFVFRWIDRVAPVGMSEGIDVYELIAERPAAGAPVDTALSEHVKQWDHAAGLYRDGSFARAETAFRSMLELYPDDAPARVMAERSARFAEEGTPDGWTGTFHTTAKKA